MRIESTPRGGGKTQKLLDWMRDSPEDEIRVIVSVNNKQAMMLLHRLREQHEDQTGSEGQLPDWAETWQFISLGELQDRRGHLWGAVRDRALIRLGFDNADLMLQGLTGGYPIDVVTMTEA